MKMIKLVATILSLALVLSLTSCVGGKKTSGSNGKAESSKSAAVKEEKPAPEEDFEIEASDDLSYVSVTKYKGKAKKVVIPATIQGVPVKVIGNKYGHMEIPTIVEEVVIPEGVVQIKGLNCGQETMSSQLKSLKLPNTLKIIEGCRDFRNLKHVDLPSSLKMIGRCAFYGTGLEDVTIPEGVEVIEEMAFTECNNLKSITLPKSIKFIGRDSHGDKTFDGDSIETINVPEGFVIYVESLGIPPYNASNFFAGAKITNSIAIQKLLKEMPLAITPYKEEFRASGAKKYRNFFLKKYFNEGKEASN